MQTAVMPRPTSHPPTHLEPLESCSHRDCRASRRMAEEACVACGQPIGWDTPFHVVHAPWLVHAACCVAEVAA